MVHFPNKYKKNIILSASSLESIYTSVLDFNNK